MSNIFAWLGRASICGSPDIEHAAKVMKDYYQGVGPETEYDQTSAPGTPEAPADDGEKEFARGVIAALGVLTPHGYTHGSVLHDEIVSTIGAKVIYRHAEDEDYAWAGLNPRKKPRKRAAQLDGGQEGSD